MQRFPLRGDPHPTPDPQVLARLVALPQKMDPAFQQTLPDFSRQKPPILLIPSLERALQALSRNQIPSPFDLGALWLALHILGENELTCHLIYKLGCEQSQLLLEAAIELALLLALQNEKLYLLHYPAFEATRAVICALPSWETLLETSTEYITRLKKQHGWYGELAWVVGFFLPGTEAARVRNPYRANPAEFTGLTGNYLKQRVQVCSPHSFQNLPDPTLHRIARTLLALEPVAGPAQLLKLAARTRQPEILTPLTETPEHALILCQGLGEPSLRRRITTLIDPQHPATHTALEQLSHGPHPSTQRCAQELLNPSKIATRLPDFLAHPPWKTNRRATSLPILDPPPSLAFTDQSHWTPQEYHEFSQRTTWLHRHPDAQKLAREVCWQPNVRPPFSLLLSLYVLPIEEALQTWEKSLHDGTHAAWGSWEGYAEELRCFWARVQLFDGKPGHFSHLESFLQFATRSPALGFTLLSHLGSPRIAPLIAKMLGNRGPHRKAAASWLESWPVAAAAGLIPAALAPGKSSAEVRARKDALGALKRLVKLGHWEPIQALARSAGVDAPISEALQTDPLLLCPARFKARPEWWSGRQIVAPVLFSGERLPESAVEAIGDMFAFSEPDLFYAGIDELDRLCTPESLDAMVLDGFCAWRDAGPEVGQRWVIRALGRFGGPASAEVLLQSLLSWGEAPALVAESWGALAKMGHDTALRILARRVAESSGSRRKLGEPLVMEAAEARGLSAEDLEDRLVDPLDLSPLIWDDKEYPVRLDELGELGLWVGNRLVSGLPELPRKATPEQKASLKVVKALWKERNKLHGLSWRREAARLERALINRRVWSKESFFEAILAHPLLGVLARRLVWEAQGRGFRVAEDGSLADIDDNPVEPVGEVRLLHPANLDIAIRSRWQRVMDDYRVVQPFPQLTREVRELPASWLGQTWGAFEGTRKVGYEGLGPEWQFGAVQYAGAWYRTSLERAIPGWTLRVGLGPPEGTLRQQLVLGVSLHVPGEEQAGGTLDQLERAWVSELRLLVESIPG